MRGLFLKLLVSVLAFVIGIAASALQSAFTPSDENPNISSMTVNIEPPKPANEPTATACRCSDEARANTGRSSSLKAPINGGILNNKAISLPKPAYPPVGKAARQEGTVAVQITIDEDGCVISARAVSGPPLLQAAAVQAAYGARFSPTRLSGQPVKVTGVVTYNFIL